MSKPVNSTSRTRSKSSAPTNRAERPATTGEDRPFAEIRRTLHDALRILFQHRWAFFVPFCTVTCAAFVLSLYYPRLYSASTAFERRNDPVMTNLPLAGGAASFKHFRGTIQRDLTSTDCLEEVVDKLGWTRDFEREENGDLSSTGKKRRGSLARSLASSLSVSITSPSEEMDIVRITYTGPDATIGAKLVDEVKRTYIRRTMAWLHGFLKSQQEYFTGEAQLASAELKRAQRGETALRLENPLVDPTNPGALSLELTQREMERRELQLRQREYQTELDSLEQLIAGLLPAVADGPPEPTPLRSAAASPQSARVYYLHSEIQKVEGEVATLKMTRGMTDLHPSIQQLIARRRQYEEELDSMQTTPVASNNAHDPPDRIHLEPAPTIPGIAPWSNEQARIAAQISTVKAKLKDLSITLEANQLALDRLGEAKRAVYEKQEEFSEAMNHVAQARQRYAQIVQTLANIEPAINAVEQDRLLQFSEGQPARGSSIPVSPSAMTVVLLALLAGAGSGVLFVVIAEVLDNVYRSSTQVAKSLGLPMLESIDEIVTGRDRRALFLRRAVLSPILVISFVGLAGLTGSMAYLSIQQPWTYQRLRRIPEAALHLFAEQGSQPTASSTGR